MAGHFSAHMYAMLKFAMVRQGALVPLVLDVQWLEPLVGAAAVTPAGDISTAGCLAKSFGVGIATLPRLGGMTAFQLLISRPSC